jgi:outer membrane protein TolC
MFKTGTSPRFDVLRADVQLAAAQERLATARNAVELMKASFNNVLGRPTESPAVLKEIPREQIPVPDLTEGLEAAIAARPELASTQKQISLAVQKERLARAGDLPTLSISSSYNRQPATAFSRNYRYDALFIVSMPVFDSGLSRHEAKQARQERMAAQSLTEERRLRIELEVKQSLLNIEDARLRIDVTAKAVSQAEEALRIANLRYQTRLAPIIEVLDAEVALTQARNNEINAWFDYELANAQWRRAVGRANGFETTSLIRSSQAAAR